MPKKLQHPENNFFSLCRSAYSVRTWNVTLVALLCFCLPALPCLGQESLKIRPELSNFEETSRYDDVIGFITRGRGVSIHRQDCPNILRVVDRERLVRVSWGEHVRTYSVPIKISAYDRTGLMGDISNLLNGEGVNIADVGVKVAHSMADLRLIVEVKDIKQLSRILTRIENIPNVLEAQRVKPG